MHNVKNFSFWYVVVAAWFYWEFPFRNRHNFKCNPNLNADGAVSGRSIFFVLVFVIVIFFYLFICALFKFVFGKSRTNNNDKIKFNVISVECISINCLYIDYCCCKNERVREWVREFFKRAKAMPLLNSWV